jgi:hypothetical protein
MMKVNTSICTIRVHNHLREHELCQRSVRPYLETSRIRPRVRAIQKTRPITYRVKVLGHALLLAHADANSFWMILSGNAEVAFPSKTTTIAAAADLPTPTTAAATSNAAIAASVAVAATLSASTTGASATANVDAPTPCQKRKARS